MSEKDPGCQLTFRKGAEALDARPVMFEDGKTYRIPEAPFCPRTEQDKALITAIDGWDALAIEESNGAKITHKMARTAAKAVILAALSVVYSDVPADLIFQRLDFGFVYLQLVGGAAPELKKTEVAGANS